MERIAPKPPLLDERKRVGVVATTRLTERLTAADDLLETSSLGVPDVAPHNWRLEICGLRRVAKPAKANGAVGVRVLRRPLPTNRSVASGRKLEMGRRRSW
jgi:hypothetical protein